MKHIILLLSLLICSLSVLPAQTSFRGSPPATAAKVDLKVYPNPAIDYISVSDNEAVRQVVVFSLVGQPVKSFKPSFKEEKFYVGDLPKGMYLVQLKNQNGKVITTQRLHKQ
ncbi:T9SS type A sorting domain-containing protein [Phaeodactylibacter luteus]|uniref:T9SS type A sorting domain-containing protein n=1 Tax=Phaeodactylibacter luteus TaxID=1564516 RepID=A0A5C6RKE2_9BACT|nr:T9SS type A sorting domain-containing protein [Phaeodactylibacter luteus]TXB62395.1 T9SS type A sorting domain-containing protein [Phaeodactylibacter luteus]